MMRIITGKARGVKLMSPEGEDTRPTSEPAKEGLFSSIQFDLFGRRVLDLFGGTGQLALEALSRGAESAVIVDASRNAAAVIRENAQRTKLFPQCRILTADWREALKMLRGRGPSSGNTFGLVFLDPPYTPGILDDVLSELTGSGLLGEDPILVCESGADGIPRTPEGFQGKQYKYGRIHISIFRKEEAE
ncbi:MAG: RsmD family RNA methyltransferase [Clostridia bacterium]|nr:RsmD family RNA methyltransferase [Clostridia bacterium]